MNLQVTEGCCGCSLRKSSLFVGWFNAVGSTLLAVLLFATGGSLFNISDDDIKDETLKQKVLLLKVIYGVLGASLIIYGITSSLLLYGIYKKKHQFMLPHVITCAIFICLQAISVLIMLLFFEAYFVDFLRTIIGMVVSIFWWRIVYSYYVELKEESIRGQSQIASPDENSYGVEKTLNNV